MFSQVSVILSTIGRGIVRIPPPPRDTPPPPPWTPRTPPDNPLPRYSQPAAGTHTTGMHSCFECVPDESFSDKWHLSFIDCITSHHNFGNVYKH